MRWVLFFDGDCGLCSRSIRRLAKWDDEGVIHFAPLQGELAERHDLKGYLDGDQASLVLLDQETGSLFTQGDGLLQILRLLGGAWRLLLVFGLLPRVLRNWIYRQISRNRRRFLRKEDSVCDLPDERLRQRMMD